MTKFVLAPDSFKESMSAKQVCQAMASGIKRVMPNAEIIEVPMADGGEGTVDALISSTNGQKITVTVLNALGEPISAYYGLLGDKKTAVIEMAQASGLEQIPVEKRNPLLTTTYGTGQLVLDALDNGATTIIIGLGGSATNDGGAGMAQALGVHLLDSNEHELAFGGGVLNELSKIDVSNLDMRIAHTKFILASDVTNVLTGKNGASVVFGPQKGATPQMVKQLDDNLSHYSDVIKHDLNKDVSQIQGAGAAGGLGAGFLAFTPATIKPGVQIVMETAYLEEKMQGADYVLTGEGGMDFQTKFGKTPYGVAQIAKKLDIPVIAMAGYLGKGIDTLYDEGFDAIFGILGGACDIKQALVDGAKNVSRTTENIIRLINVR